MKQQEAENIGNPVKPAEASRVTVPTRSGCRRFCSVLIRYVDNSNGVVFSSSKPTVMAVIMKQNVSRRQLEASPTVSQNTEIPQNGSLSFSFLQKLLTASSPASPNHLIGWPAELVSDPALGIKTHRAFEAQPQITSGLWDIPQVDHVASSSSFPILFTHPSLRKPAGSWFGGSGKKDPWKEWGSFY